MEKQPIERQGMDEQQRKDDLVESPANQRKEKARMNTMTRSTGRAFFCFGVVLVFGAPIVLVVASSAHHLLASLAGLFFIYGVLCLIFSLYMDSVRRTRENEIEELDFQIYLNQLGGSSITEMKHLRASQLQLRRYYDQNLGQNDRVFYLGMLCIFLGIGVIGATFYLVKVTDSANAQIVTGAIGGVGVLMTNFVAAIYLKMHGAIAGNLGTFHSKLADTHKVLLALLVASRIENTDKREETLKQLALTLSRDSSDTRDTYG